MDKIFSISKTRQNWSLPSSMRSAKGRSCLVVRFWQSSSDVSLLWKDSEPDFSESHMFGNSVDGSDSRQPQLSETMWGIFFSAFKSYKQTRNRLTKTGIMLGMWSVFRMLSHSKQDKNRSAKTSILESGCFLPAGVHSQKKLMSADVKLIILLTLNHHVKDHTLLI